ncbi:hypothetical protein FACS1894188_13640 [Clostridia bacterium]|nr:hypothetical protein FACS1894188_13640 [Clostridia bacterium]
MGSEKQSIRGFGIVNVHPNMDIDERRRKKAEIDSEIIEVLIANFGENRPFTRFRDDTAV